MGFSKQQSMPILDRYFLKFGVTNAVTITNLGWIILSWCILQKPRTCSITWMPVFIGIWKSRTIRVIGRIGTVLISFSAAQSKPKAVLIAISPSGQYVMFSVTPTSARFNFISSRFIFQSSATIIRPILAKASSMITSFSVASGSIELTEELFSSSDYSASIILESFQVITLFFFFFFRFLFFGS